MKIKIYLEDSGFVWEIAAANGTVLASSDIVFTHRKTAVRGLCRFLNLMAPKNPPRLVTVSGQELQLRKDSNGFYMRYQ